MEWLAADDQQTSCDGDICSTSMGVKVVGRYSDKGQPWANLTVAGSSSAQLTMRYAGGDRWQLNQESEGIASGWSTWQGKRYALSCALGNPRVNMPAAGTRYRLEAKHSKKFLDVTWAAKDGNAPVGQPGRSEAEGGGAQIWQLEAAGGSYYRLKVQHSGLYLDVTWADKRNHAPVGQAGRSSAVGGGAQMWRLIPTMDGWFRLQAKHSGLYLDVMDGNMANNVQVGQSELSDWRFGSAQLWRFIPQ